MNLPLRYALSLACCALLLSAGTPVAQNAPAGAPPAAGQRPAPAAPENLQVLPKDISRQDLSAMMRGFTQQLGVGCEFCHAANPAPKSADTNPVKAKARIMIAMTNDINSKYLTQIGADHKQITCGNCHLGHEEPPAFTPAPRAPGGPGGPGGPPPAGAPVPPAR